MSIVLKKIISGGQTGVDIAALRAVRVFNATRGVGDVALQTGGRCPSDYMTSAGRNMELASFGLVPMSGGSLADQYVARSRMNVQESDATLAFRFKKSRGTDSTIAFATTNKWGALRNCEIKNGKAMASIYKPTCVVTKLGDCTWSVIADIRAFLIRYNVHTLNICGHRDTRYEREVQEFLEILFRDLFK